MFVIKNRKIFFAISVILVVASLLLVLVRGLQIGIDFTGGSIIEVEYIAIEGEVTTPVSIDVLTERTSELGLGTFAIQPTGETGYIFRSKSLEENERLQFMRAIEIIGYETVEKRVNTIGPTIGQELRSKAWIAIVTVVIAIILFIAYVFRGVSDPVSSWRYGFIAIIALVHDIVISIGVASLIGIEIDSLFVIALLAILGLSVNDTIVVFDRIRENLKNKVSRNFAETIGISLKQTFVRSINTSITTLFVVLGLFFLGPDATKDFALILAVGLIAGTYSSIFLASPLLVEVEKMNKE